MNVKENIGIVNALIRITVGLTLLALGVQNFLECLGGILIYL